MHKYQVGQWVVPAQSNSSRPDIYEIVRLMPATGSGEPQYRIKGQGSGTERMVRESEIKPASGTASP